MSNTYRGGRGTLHEVEGSSPAELPAIWRARAEVLAENGAEGQARAVKRCAEQLELALKCHGEETVSLTRAARDRGYTPDHIGRLVRQGKFKNYGRPGAPRVRLSEIPFKPGYLPPVSGSPHLVGATCREIARAVASEEVQ